MEFGLPFTTGIHQVTEPQAETESHVLFQNPTILGRKKIRRVTEFHPGLDICSEEGCSTMQSTYPETNVLLKMLLKFWALLLDVG